MTYRCSIPVNGSLVFEPVHRAYVAISVAPQVRTYIGVFKRYRAEAEEITPENVPE